MGDLQLDEHGLAIRGLLVRLLVLPNNLAGTRQTVRFLAQEISPNTYLNLMDQYHPSYKFGNGVARHVSDHQMLYCKDFLESVFGVL